MCLLRARRVVFRRPNGTKLAHHVQLVGDAPVLDDLAPDNRSTVMLLILRCLPVGATPKRSPLWVPSSA